MGPTASPLSGMRRLFFAVLLLLSTAVFPTVLSRDCRTSWRRAWRDLSCEQQDEYLEAVLLLKDSGVYDEFTTTHSAFIEEAHDTPEFLPWHRWFVYQFEKALQDAAGKCIYVPYWDWERDAEWEWESTVFHEDTFGSYQGVDGQSCTIDGITDMNSSPSWWIPSDDDDDGQEGCLERTFNDELSFAGESQLLAMIANYDQYANTASGDDVNGFRTEFESGPHALVHSILGGHMGSNRSPSDPLFYLHHANIDRIWTMWQDYWDHDECNHDDYWDPWHYEGDLLDERLPFRASDVSWDFRMEYTDGSLDFPTPRDVLSNDGPNFRVKYQNDYLASLVPGYEPNPRLFQVADDDVDIQCDRNEWRRKLRYLHSLGESNFEGLELKMKQEALSGKRSSVRGIVINVSGGNPEYPTSCQQRNIFTRQEDREQWDRLCREMPSTTSIAERLAVLAEVDCERRGNPRSDSKMLTGHLKMSMEAPRSAFACFHRPDQA